MSRAGLVVAVALLALTGSAAADGAPVLDQAEQAIGDIDYEAARDLLATALAAGGLDRAELARAHRLAGEVAAALGDATAARGHFVRWILLEPGATLRAGLSPKIVEPFTAARAEAGRLGRFTLDIEVARDAERVRIELTAKDPLALVAGMRVRLGDSSEVGITGPRAVLPAADAAAIDVEVTVVDGRGNVLSRETFAGTAIRAVAPPAGPAAEPGTRVHHRLPAVVRWPTWAALTVVAAGTGGYFAYRVGQAEDELAALNADSSAHSFDEAIAIQERGDRDARFTSVGFGVAGVAAVATVLTYVLDVRRVEVLPAPAGATAGASVGLHF